MILQGSEQQQLQRVKTKPSLQEKDVLDDEEQGNLKKLKEKVLQYDLKKKKKNKKHNLIDFRPRVFDQVWLILNGHHSNLRTTVNFFISFEVIQRYHA